MKKGKHRNEKTWQNSIVICVFKKKKHEWQDVIVRCFSQKKKTTEEQIAT